MCVNNKKMRLVMVQFSDYIHQCQLQQKSNSNTEIAPYQGNAEYDNHKRCHDNSLKQVPQLLKNARLRQ